MDNYTLLEDIAETPYTPVSDSLEPSLKQSDEYIAGKPKKKGLWHKVKSYCSGKFKGGLKNYLVDTSGIMLYGNTFMIAKEKLFTDMSWDDIFETRIGAVIAQVTTSRIFGKFLNNVRRTCNVIDDSPLRKKLAVDCAAGLAFFTPIYVGLLEYCTDMDLDEIISATASYMVVTSVFASTAGRFINRWRKVWKPDKQ